MAISLVSILCEARNTNVDKSLDVKTSIDRFPPILEYVIQRIQGYYSVHVHDDQSLFIYQTTQSSDTEVPQIQHDEVMTVAVTTPTLSTTEEQLINRTDQIEQLEEYVLQHHTLNATKPTYEVVLPIRTKDEITKV